MLGVLSKHITQWLVEKKVIAETDWEVYEYGVFQLVMNLVDTLTILALAIYFHEIWATVCFAASFAALRKYAGGYHAHTVLACYLFTTTVTLLTILTIKYTTIPLAVMLGVWTVVGLTIVLLAPVENRNKPLDEVEYIVYRKRALLVWLGECVLLVALEISGFRKCFEGVLAGQCCVALAMCLEMIHGKSKKGD